MLARAGPGVAADAPSLPCATAHQTFDNQVYISIIYLESSFTAVLRMSYNNKMTPQAYNV